MVQRRIRHMELFREYDVRGFYPEDINGEVAYKLGKAFATYLKCKNIAISRDTRLSGKEIRDALVKAFTESGIDVIDLGVNGTDFLFFSVGHYGYDAGVQITASHMPKDFNGMKVVKKGAIPISFGAGLEEVREIYEEEAFIKPTGKKGKVTGKKVVEDFVKSVLAFIDIQRIKPMKIVVDAGSGVGGLLINQVFKDLPCKVIPLNFEMDGNFPVHDPNPFLAENRKQLIETVKKEKADMGVAFDGDADRTIFVNEKGEYVQGEFIVGILASEILKTQGSGKVLHESRAEWFIRDMVKKHGGTPVRVRCGYSNIKKAMYEQNAIFGGEKSGHTFYRFDEFIADNAMIPILQILSMMSKENKTFSELMQVAENYYDSLEMNFELTPEEGKTKEQKFAEVVRKVEEYIQEKYKNGEVNKIDTLSIEYPTWRFNLRPSANDPVLRLNIEAKTEELLNKKISEMKAFLEQVGAKMLPL